jgi:hypothetical protein
MDDPTDFPTPAQQLAAVLDGSGKVTYMAAMKPVLARIPATQLIELDAMAKLAGKSRSAMVVHLLSVAIQEVRAAASPETRERLDAEAQPGLRALFEESKTNDTTSEVEEA